MGIYSPRKKDTPEEQAAMRSVLNKVAVDPVDDLYDLTVTDKIDPKPKARPLSKKRVITEKADNRHPGHEHLIDGYGQADGRKTLRLPQALLDDFDWLCAQRGVRPSAIIRWLVVGYVS